MNIYIKTTEQCNLHCLHCYTPAVNKQIDFDRLDYFLSTINTNENDFFILHGGEPLMGDIKKTISLVKKYNNVNWRITTNLTCELTEEKIDLLKRMKQVRTSFDIKIRFKNIKNLLRWIRNIKKLSSMNIDLWLNICLSDYVLQKDPIKICDLCKKLKIKTLSFERITRSGRGEFANFIPSYSKIDDWLCSFFYEYKNYMQYFRCAEFDNIVAGIVQNNKVYRGAECCKNTITINADGTIGECPDSANNKILGTYNNDIYSILNKKESCKIKNTCLACNLFTLCHGSCKAYWGLNECPYPKKLSKVIKNEYIPIIQMQS